MSVFRLLLFFVLCVSLPVGCSSNETTTPVENTKDDVVSKPYVRCTIVMPDGNTVQFTSASGSFLHSSYEYTAESSTSNFSLSYSSLSLGGYFEGQTPQSHTFGNGVSALSLSSPLGKPVALPRITSDSGTLVIESLSADTQSLRGTFSGVFTSANGEKYTVTDGAFYIKGK